MNIVSGGILFGAEISANLANITGTGDNAPFEGDTESLTTSFDQIALGQLKAGAVIGQVAAYVSGGVAIAHATGSYNWQMSNSWHDVVNYESLASGWTVGGGLDVMVSETSSIGLTYNYVDLDPVFVDEFSMGQTTDLHGDREATLQIVTGRFSTYF